MWQPLEFIDNSYTELFEFLTYNFLSIIFIWHGTVPICVFYIFPHTNYAFVFLNLLIFLVLAYLAHFVHWSAANKMTWNSQFLFFYI